MTQSALRRLGPRVGLSARQIEALAERETARADVGLADWVAPALLELTHRPAFRADSRWIAQTLNVSIDRVNLSLQTLARLGLLEMRDRGRWLDKLDPSHEIRLLVTTRSRAS